MKNKEIEELLNNIKEQLIIDEKLGKEIAQDFHKTILNYEETKLLLSYIEQLQKTAKDCKRLQKTAKDCKQKVDQYENPDDLTLFYMWLDTKAKDKMKQLERRNKQLYEGFMATQEELTDYATENEQLENNRDEAIEFIENHFLYHYGSDKAPIVFEDNYIQKIVDILKGDSK